MRKEEVLKIVRLALEEDIGGGDTTTELVIDEVGKSRAEIMCKDEGRIIVCGHLPARLTFAELDADCSYEELIPDGEEAMKGQVVARLSGKTKGLLSAERVALNFICHLTGVATQAAQFAKKTELVIRDTRKTIPGLRILQKYAVRCGGLENHRMGLFDGVMIKDNHIRATGSIAEAVRRARKGEPPKVEIEVEAQTIDQVEEALGAGVDIIMLDNMTVEQIREAVALIEGRAQVEVSGGIDLDNVREYEGLGIDFVSIGALTHSVRSANLSLEFVE